MNIVIFSDSHGNRANMRQVLEKERPQVVFHLGDGRTDILEVLRDWPGLELHSVVGNCDWRSRGPAEELVTLEGLRMLLAHGHAYGVKSGYGSYLAYGMRRQAQILLAGHTHTPCIWEDRGILLVNPGSVGNSPRPTYAVLEVEAGQVKRVEIRPVEKPVYGF